MARAVDDIRQTLRALSTSDDVIDDLLNVREANVEDSGLDARTWSLVKLAALVSIDAAPASYVWHLANAKQSGVTPGEVVGVLIALAPTIGIARIVAAAPEIAIGLGIEADDEDVVPTDE
jgi:4-carboxymuconolactone decarboxylase